jgi:hypothetical protein
MSIMIYLSRGKTQAPLHSSPFTNRRRLSPQPPHHEHAINTTTACRITVPFNSIPIAPITSMPRSITGTPKRHHITCTHTSSINTQSSHPAQTKRYRPPLPLWPRTRRTSHNSSRRSACNRTYEIIRNEPRGRESGRQDRQ